MTIVPALRRVALLGLALLTTACAVTGPGEVASKWSCKLSEMQIIPVFPPREDVRVGDIYWLPDAKAGKTDPANAYCNWNPADGFLKIGTHVAYTRAISDEMSKHYEARPALPQAGTSTISVTSAGSSAFTIASSTRPLLSSAQGTQTIFGTGKTDRARLVAFPDFMSVQVRSFSMGAVVPILGVFTPMGASNDTMESAEISIPAAESLGLPLLDALRVLHTDPMTQSSTVCNLAETLDSADFDKSTGALYLIHEVFYARAIDVAMQARDGFAFSFARDREGATTATLPTLNGSTATVTITEAPGIAQANSAAAAAARGVIEMIDLRNSMPGVTMGVRRGGSSRIAMTRVFDHPVAVGIRATRIKTTALGDKSATPCRVSVQVGNVATPGPANTGSDGERRVPGSNTNTTGPAAPIR